MLLAKTFTVPVELVVKPAPDVTTSQKPFFDPGATTSKLASEKSGPGLDQVTGEAVEEMETATQPLGAPGAGIATQPVQAPGSFPEVQPTGEGDVSAASDIEADQLSDTGSLDDEIHRDRSADREVSRDDPDSEPTEEANYRETMRVVRSFMNWHKVPEFETVSFTADDNPFAGGTRCRVLTSHSQRATQLEIQTIPVSSEISLLKLPDLQGGTGCMLRRTLRAQQYAPGHRILQNSTIPSAGWLEEIYLLPHPPGPSVKSYSGGGKEQPENRQ